MNNYIGIDISLNSTAVFIENQEGMKILSFTNKKDNNIYIKELEQCGVSFHFIYDEKDSKYSENEILKIKKYDKLSDNIVNTIIDNINVNDKTFCNMEGYSYSKNTSSILDIVALSTLIRCKMINHINNIELSIIAPASLKKEACGLVYGFDKKKNTKNNQGISGGRFKKPEMYLALLESNLETPISKMIFNYKDLIERKKIPNPIEDIIDSIFACKVKMKQLNDIR